MSFSWPAVDLETNRVRLHCYRLGAGRPLLLLHGITANGLTWGRAAEALAQRHEVIAADLRGHGSSDAPEGPYRDDDFVADVAGLIAQLAREPIDVIGHSLGGRIAMQLAASRPNVVGRLILEEAIGSRNDSISKEDAGAMRRGALAWLESLRSQPREAALAQVRQQSPTWTELECEAFADGLRGFSPSIFADGGMDYRFDWRAFLPRIECPTLVLGGDPKAALFPPSTDDDLTAEEARCLLPRGTVIQIANAGHMLHLDQPDRFVEVVEAFLG